MGPQIYHYGKIFWGKMGYIPLGAPCSYMMGIIDHSNAAMPFVATVFPTLWTAPTNHCHYAAKCQI